MPMSYELEKRSLPVSAEEAPVVIEQTGPGDAEAWDDFVTTDPAATFFHRFGWARVLSETFDYEPVFLIARQGACVVGILPLVCKRSVIFGSALISLPFCTACGPLAITTSIAEALIEHACKIAADLRVNHIELRSNVSGDAAWLREDATYATFLKRLEPNPDAIMAAIPRKGRRHALRKSLAANLTFGEVQEIDEFYDVLAESFRNLGTPIFPTSYFKSLLRAFPGDIRLFVVRQTGRAVAASLAFVHRDQLQPFYAGGRAAARESHANDFLFFKLMCHALEMGISCFDFGRSRAMSGSFAYKRHWGFEPQFLTYSYRLASGKRLPDITPQNPRLRLSVEAWKHLPLGISRVIGPRLVRHLG